MAGLLRVASYRRRARSIHLTQSELVEIRAAQRTFEGAYIRTALSQFSFALVVLKIFTREFYPIGALFSAFGLCILMVAWVRRGSGNRQFFREGERRKFRTSGNVSMDLDGGIEDGIKERADFDYFDCLLTILIVLKVVMLVGCISVVTYSMLLWLILRL
ncbi:hypothetical protein EX30DRAFT_370799 [Ascodesmis nigricans]|uniref:Uncharacterized protein n=1 Tax=Ascodesmis nigricans TaxID=341454 RepID=A0A4S2MZC6_9PEZI|nr:hypothetical protein EX30DRAFT_370799 [Ascodesmis nigricans]